MKKLQYILQIFLIHLLMISGGCSSEMPVVSTPQLPSDEFSVQISMDVPALGQTFTRGFGTTPDYENLKLYLVEFNLVGTPLENDYTGYSIVSYHEPTPAANPDHVVFTASLKKADNMSPKVLHLIAVPESTNLDFGSEGLEGNIMSSIATMDGVEAYWQRIEFPNGYGETTTDAEGNEVWKILDETRTKLTMVPMIRNFAQVSVNLDLQEEEEGQEYSFVLEGYALVNVPSAGTVTTWNANTLNFQKFVDESKQQIAYDDLAGYDGTMAGNIIQYDDAAYQFTNSPKFLYERQRSSYNQTQLIIKGNYNNEGSSYYKIDFGRLDENAKFNFYKMLRNFNYVVNIKRVATSGYANAVDAVNGVVFNNLSFDVRTQKMLNVSNGFDQMRVNFTTAVVTQDTEEARTLEFRYRYDENINSGGGGTTNNNNVEVIGLDEQPESDSDAVIEDVTDFSLENGWMVCKIKTYAPVAGETRTKSFIVINKNTGLGRTINIILTYPYPITNLVEYAGNYNNPLSIDDPDLSPSKEDRAGKAGAGTQAPLTVFFDIPHGLPEAIFPLTFVLESDYHNVENNPVGQLIVSSGTSLFDPTSPVNSIQYKKIVTLADYNSTPNETHNGTLISSPSGTVHRVRCRFLTVSSLENLGMTESSSVVRIHNPFFGSKNNDDTYNYNFDVKFDRNVNWTAINAITE